MDLMFRAIFYALNDNGLTLLFFHPILLEHILL